MKSIAYLGPEGTFSAILARQRFGEGPEYLACGTTEGIFDRVVSGEASLGLIPVENSSGGTVYDAVDLLLRHAGKITIREELSLDIRIALLGRVGKSVKTVYSHFIQIKHHGEWLKQNLPAARLVPVASTAVAAKRAAESPGAAPGAVCRTLRGAWTQASAMPSARALLDAVARPGVTTLVFATQDLGEWDSMLPMLVLELTAQGAVRRLTVDTAGLPDGVRTLVALATPAAPSVKSAPGVPDSFLQRLGRETATLAGLFAEMVCFIGATVVALVRWLRGAARVRACDVILQIRECGADALPIVSLVSVLVGVIFAFVGILQLRQFGVEIYVADLVAVIMIRVMGAVMVGIVLAGRTGSAFAAQLGTMQVNEEIDSLRVLGIPPMEFLVLPRVVALAVMMPLLCLYADFLGVCGGMVVGVNALHLNIVEYLQRTQAAVSVPDVLVGLVHSAVFGVLIAMAGCLCGMRCRRSAEAVGQAATSAVVLSIVSIIAATSIITAVCNVLGI